MVTLIPAGQEIGNVTVSRGGHDWHSEQDARGGQACRAGQRGGVARQPSRPRGARTALMRLPKTIGRLP